MRSLAGAHQVLRMQGMWAGLLVAVDVAMVSLVVWRGGAAAYPDYEPGRHGQRIEWAPTMAPIYAATIVTIMLGEWLLARMVRRSSGPALMMLGACTVPLFAALAMAVWASPLYVDSVCSLCDAISYERAPGYWWYTPARMVLLAALAVGHSAALALASTRAVTHDLFGDADPPRRARADTVAANALVAMAFCGAVLTVTTALIAATARRAPSGDRVVATAVSALLVAATAAALWLARRVRKGRVRSAAVLTASGVSVVLWSALILMCLLLTPRGGVVPSGWRVEVAPTWLREAHGLVAWAAAITCLFTIVALIWVVTTSRRRGDDQPILPS